MPRLLPLLFCFLLSAPSLCLASSPADEIPDILESGIDDGRPTYPWWVSAKALTTPGNRLNQGILAKLHPATIQMILGLLARDPDDDGCIRADDLGVEVVEPDTWQTPVEAAAEADLTLLGRVAQVGGGFSGSLPGSLVRLEVETARPADLSGQTYFFFLPVGEVHVASQRICRAERSYTVLPEPGDLVLIFARYPPPGLPEIILINSPYSVITIKTEVVHYPWVYSHLEQARDLPSGLHDLLDRIGLAYPKGMPR